MRLMQLICPFLWEASVDHAASRYLQNIQLGQRGEVPVPDWHDPGQPSPLIMIGYI